VGTDNFTSITNVEKNAGFTLPLTGGSGTAALTIGGIAILAAVLVVARRRRAYEATV
jgi:LPXTG-motif cell wall-anchored protein